MRILGILCLIHGVQSAALHGLRQVQRHDIEVTIDATEPPVFVVHGFLAHTRNTSSITESSSVGHRRQWANAEDHAAMKDACTKACGKGVDSSCVPECQVRLYTCLDYDRKVPEGAKRYEECEAEVLKTYSKFGENWEATHPYTTDMLLRSNGHVSATDLDNMQDECVGACGEGVDTSCVPECQVKMYQCLDHDRKVPEGLKKYEKCEKEVLATYRNFAEDWDKTHPYLMAIGRHASAKKLRFIHDKCSKDCGSKSKRSCASRCQTASYACLHIDVAESSTDYTACTDTATSKVAQIEAKSLATSAELDAVGKACSSACGLGIDASCIPECEVQMYECVESSKRGTSAKDQAKTSSECTRKVIVTYEKFASDWNAAHPNLLSRRGHADAEVLEEMRDGCVDACGVGVDSSCVPECQVKMYTCLDHDRKTEDGAKKYKKCTSEVLAKYEQFADDWDAAHPYLLAVHRHVSSVELARVEDKCTDACGKGVDSSCVPECQVEMYQCLDHDRKTEEGAKLYDECESKVIAEYTDFGAKWNATHPY